MPISNNRSHSGHPWTVDTNSLSVECTDLERGLEHHVHDAVALVEVGHRVRVALLLLDHPRQCRQEVHEEGAVQVLAQLRENNS